MRKITTVLITIVLLLSCSLTAFAAEDHLDESKTQTEIGVYAKAEYNIEGVHPAPVKDDTAEVVTDDGITVTVTDAPEGSVCLMVIPVPETEKEAWKWIESSLKDTADPVHTFDIYFEDQDGKRMDANGAVVTLNCPHCKEIPVVCSLDTDGTVNLLTISSVKGTVTFTTDGSSYYIMADKLPTQVTDPDSPQTGDNSNLWLWIALLFVSGGALITLTVVDRRRRTAYKR